MSFLSNRPINTADQGPHNADWRSADLQRVMDSLKCNVAGAVTDNTSTNKKAWRILHDRSPTRFFHGCVSHGLHLMVKDIFAATKRKPPGGGAGEPSVYRDGYPFEYLLHFANACKDVVIYFHNHQAPKAVLKAALKAANLPRLVAPAPTRWGSLIGCFRSLLAADAVLNAIVSHRNFESNGTLKQKEQKRAITLLPVTLLIILWYQSNCWSQLTCLSQSFKATAFRFQKSIRPLSRSCPRCSPIWLVYLKQRRRIFTS